ncbi:MAG: PilN domain-containing protein [Comamonadaceae bacterium]|nr:PilN domain-containing protein [Comamonadaceae bacterium]
MAQQVNLCLPVLRKRTSRFAAQSLAQALATLLVVGGVLSAVWVSNLGQASASLKLILDAQTKELDGLRAAIERSKQSSAPVEQTLAQEIKTRRASLQQREKVLAALSQGLFQPGDGHAARLLLVAQSIPDVVWVTSVKADDYRLEVGGFTLEPAALNPWVNRLAGSTLLRGQILSTVKVESVKPESLLAGGGARAAARSAIASPAALAASGAVATTALPPVWSFSLVSSTAQPVADKTAAGGKP